MANKFCSSDEGTSCSSASNYTCSSSSYQDSNNDSDCDKNNFASKHLPYKYAIQMKNLSVVSFVESTITLRISYSTQTKQLGDTIINHRCFRKGKVLRTLETGGKYLSTSFK